MDTQITSAPITASAEPHAPTLVRGISLTDATLLIIGGIIGSAIFLTPSDVAQQMRTPLLFLLVWAAGGFVTLISGLSFAELGAMYPEAGGQYVYLREAFGDFAAFLYGWLMFIAGNSGGIAAIVVAYAQYLGKAFPAVAAEKAWLTLPGLTFRGGQITSRTWNFTAGDAMAVSAIVVLTAINVWGLRRGVFLQNISTWLKYAALAAFVVFGFTIGKGNWSNLHFAGGVSQLTTPSFATFMSAMGVAFIAVFWCYDGWVYVSWVAGEVREPQRNIPRSLIFGILSVIAIYMLMNAAYLYSTPLDQIASASAIGESAARTLFSPLAAWLLSIVIAISSLGAAGSCVLSGARVSYAMAIDGLFFRKMGDVHPQFRTPWFALVAQGIMASLIALSGTYDQLFTYCVFGMVLSYVACVIAMFVLRRTQPDLPRPYRCHGYPWLPALYIILIGGWLLNTLVTRPTEALACTALMALGVPWYMYWKRTARPA
ncbi:MAG: APC family permease [Terriglobales bacterium]